jgi:hypothetical protein
MLIWAKGMGFFSILFKFLVIKGTSNLLHHYPFQRGGSTMYPWVPLQSNHKQRQFIDDTSFGVLTKDLQEVTL